MARQIDPVWQAAQNALHQHHAAELAAYRARRDGQEETACSYEAHSIAMLAEYRRIDEMVERD